MRRGASAVLAVLTCAAAVLAGCSGAEVERQQREEKAKFHYELANGYFYSRNVDLAIRELINALSIDEDHANSRYLYGFILFGRKRYEEASEHFRRALKARPKFYEARNHLAVTYLELERPYDAIVTAEPLLKEPTYTTHYLPHNTVGLAYLKQGDLRQAEKHLRMAVFLNPKFCQGHRNLGLLAIQQRDYKAAVEHTGESVRLCPQYADLHLQHAEALEADGQMERADEAWRKCAEIAGESPLGRRCKARLRGTAAWPLPATRDRARATAAHGAASGGRWQHASAHP